MFLLKQSAKAWQTRSTVPRLQYSPEGPWCPAFVRGYAPCCPAASEEVWVTSPFCSSRQTGIEQLLELATSLDSNTAHIFFLSDSSPLFDNATVRSPQHPLFSFLYFKVTLSLKRKV